MPLKYQGILPLAKSTFSEDIKTRSDTLKTRSGFYGLTERVASRDRRRVETSSEKDCTRRGLAIEAYPNQNQQDVESYQPELQEAFGVVFAEDSQVAFKPGFEKLNSGSVLGWSLPGHGSPYSDCGSWIFRGCLDVEAHAQERIDQDVAGKVFVEVTRRSCLRAVCPICYEKWAGKEAHKIEYRFSQWKGSGKAIHVMISVPRGLWNVPLEGLRSKIYKVARGVGFFGGSCIPHPFRQICDYCGSPKDSFTDRCLNCGCSEFSWVFSPHFHLIGYGWIRGDRVKELYEREGWITKNLGLRDSVIATAQYQLSHAGIKEGKHTVTWFGAFSYNKLRVVPEVQEKPCCPLCGAELVLLRWRGGGDPPFEEEGEYLDSPENWGWRGFG